MGPPWLPLRQHRTGRTLVADDGERLRLAQRVLLALALLAGALVLWRDHGHRRRRRGGGGESSSRTPEATVPADATSSSGPDDDRMPRRLMDGLAALAVASALLGTFTPDHALSLPPMPGDQPRHSLHHVRTVSEGPAVALVLLAVAGLAAEAAFIWGLLLHRHQLWGGGGGEDALAVPRWWRRTAHAYIWIAYIAPNVVQLVPTQIVFRRDGFMGFFMGVDVGSPQFVASVIVSGLTLVVPLLLRGGLMFRTGLDYLLEPAAIAHDPARLLAWQRHALQTFLYLALSLAASVFLWFALMLYPTNFLVAVMVTPFLLFLLLAVYLCFGALPAWWRWRDRSRSSSKSRRGATEGEERKDGDGDGDGDGDVDTPGALRRIAEGSDGSDGSAAAGRGGGVEKDGGGGKGKKGPNK